MVNGKESVLVVGGGSIGERHARCFLETGRATVSLCDANAGRLAELAKSYPLAETFRDWETLPLDRYSVVVICTPAPLHEPMAVRALQAGCNVLVEKPLTLDVEAAEHLRRAAAEAHGVSGNAYVYRSMAVLRDLQARIAAREIGRVRHVLGVMGQEFPRYRPAYADVYYRSHASGGGAIQDAITHIVNLVQWCIGLETHITCQAEHLVLPRVEVEDTVALTLRKPGEFLVSLTLNQFQKNNDMQIDFAGESGTLRYDLRRARIGINRGEEWQWSDPYPAERDTHFLRQANAFLDAVAEKVEFPCSIAAGAETVRSITAALQSWKEGCEIRVR